LTAVSFLMGMGIDYRAYETVDSVDT
jgi:hypothetical protein